MFETLYVSSSLSDFPSLSLILFSSLFINSKTLFDCSLLLRILSFINISVSVSIYFIALFLILSLYEILIIATSSSSCSTFNFVLIIFSYIFLLSPFIFIAIFPSKFDSFLTLNLKYFVLTIWLYLNTLTLDGISCLRVDSSLVCKSFSISMEKLSPSFGVNIILLAGISLVTISISSTSIGDSLYSSLSLKYWTLKSFELESIAFLFI